MFLDVVGHLMWNLGHSDVEEANNGVGKYGLKLAARKLSADDTNVIAKPNCFSLKNGLYC